MIFIKIKHPNTTHQPRYSISFHLISTLQTLQKNIIKIANEISLNKQTIVLAVVIIQLVNNYKYNNPQSFIISRSDFVQSTVKLTIKRAPDSERGSLECR